MTRQDTTVALSIGETNAMRLRIASLQSISKSGKDRLKHKQTGDVGETENQGPYELHKVCLDFSRNIMSR